MTVWGEFDAIRARVEGVTLRFAPMILVPSGDPLTVEISCLTGTADLERQRREWRTEPLAVGLDLAHDLSWQGPHAYLLPDRGDWSGVLCWRITVLGFVEQEAVDAFGTVCDAIEQARVPAPMRGD
jgi:hypothetical protein